MTDTTNKRKGGWWALSPLAVFLCFYLVTSLIVNDFYKVPITVAFLLSSCYAIALTRGLSLEKRVYQFSVGASNKNIILMIWIFILAGAFAQSAKQMGAIDATVNLTLSILPDNLLLAGIFIAACFISLSIGTSVGTIVALTPVAIGLAEKTGIDLPYMVAIVVGGSFFGDNLSFISDTTIASTKTQDCVMRDKFRVNFMIVVPAALIVLCIYIFQGLSITAPAQTQEIEWIKVIPYLIVLGTAVAGVNVMLVLLLGILSTGIIGIFTSETDLSTAFFDWFGSMGTGITGMGSFPACRRYAGNDPLQWRNRLHYLPPDAPCKRQTRSGTEHRRTCQHRQPLYGKQHHRHYYHRTDSQRHCPTFPPGSPEDSQHPGHILLPGARHHSLWCATTHCRRIGRHLSHQYHRQLVLSVYNGNLCIIGNISEISETIFVNIRPYSAKNEIIAKKYGKR